VLTGFAGRLPISGTEHTVKSSLAASTLVVLLSAFLLAGCGGGSSNTSGQRSLIGGSLQGTLLSLSQVVSTFAGTASVHGSADCVVGAAATFYSPGGVTTDGTNLYVADTGNSTIRKVVIATGEVTTLSGTAGIFGHSDNVMGSGGTTFNAPFGITTDGTNLYVADTINHEIRKVTISTGAVTTLAGWWPLRGGYQDSTPVQSLALFDTPLGITTDGTNLYVADTYNHLIRKIVIATGIVSTLAGTFGVTPGHIDNVAGPGGTTFNTPKGITTDGTNLYIADSGNDLIRRVTIATGAVTTVAGTAEVSGHDDNVLGPGGTTFSNPLGITTDGMNLYLTETNNHLVRKVTIATGAVTTVAGTAGVGGSNDNTVGSGVTTFNIPCGITTDGTSLYVAENGNHTIRKIR
jgi:sugar lactone lactonase YvrE